MLNVPPRVDGVLVGYLIGLQRVGSGDGLIDASRPKLDERRFLAYTWFVTESADN